MFRRPLCPGACSPGSSFPGTGWPRPHLLCSVPAHDRALVTLAARHHRARMSGRSDTALFRAEDTYSLDIANRRLLGQGQRAGPSRRVPRRSLSTSAPCSSRRRDRRGAGVRLPRGSAGVTCGVRRGPSSASLIVASPRSSALPSRTGESLGELCQRRPRGAARRLGAGLAAFPDSQRTRSRPPPEPLPADRRLQRAPGRVRRQQPAARRGLRRGPHRGGPVAVQACRAPSGRSTARSPTRGERSGCCTRAEPVPRPRPRQAGGRSAGIDRATTALAGRDPEPTDEWS